MDILEQETNEVTRLRLEQAILDISSGIVGLRKMLKEDDIILLIQARSKVTRTEIKAVLAALTDLRKTYVKR